MNEYNVRSNAPKMKMASKRVSSSKRISVRRNTAAKQPLDRKSFNRAIASLFDDKYSLPISPSRTNRNINYDSSFGTILQFSKSIPETVKQSIDIVIFHAENSDGMMSAYVTWRYLKENGKTVTIIGAKPSSSDVVDFRIKRLEETLRGKVVLVVDISYGETMLNYIRGVAKDLYVIDDHSTEERNIITAKSFIGTDHAACAYTWKFFYPTVNVPRFIKYVDSDDHKLFLKDTPYTNLFSITMGIRYSHVKVNRYESIMEELDGLVKMDRPELFIMIGNYFDEIRTNLVKQIAINYKVRSFQGYRVAVLNFGSPLLSKPVGREMLEMAKQNGDDVEFAVLWLYEYTSNAYRLDLISDHSPSYKGPKLNILAKKIWDKSNPRHERGAGGSPNGYKGNLYLARSDKQDIWSLFDDNARRSRKSSRTNKRNANVNNSY